MYIGEITFFHLSVCPDVSFLKLLNRFQQNWY